MKLLLTVQNGSLSGNQIHLEEGFLVLGRSHDCHLRFHSEQDRGVSAHHALIRLDSDGYRLIDQKSTNGTLLNGKFVEQALLRSGDIIQLGRQGPRIHVATGQESVVTPQKLRDAIVTLGIYHPQKDQQWNYVGTALTLLVTGALLFLVMALFV